MDFSPLVYLRVDKDGVPYISVECMGCDEVLFTMEAQQMPVSARSIDRDAQELHHICEEEK